MRKIAYSILFPLCACVAKNIPTDDPTIPPKSTLTTTLVFDKEYLKTAVNEWISNKEEAINKYGDIKHCNKREFSSMNRLFINKINFNEGISLWYTSSVTDMSYIFYSNKAFDIDLSGWDTINVKHMSAMFLLAIIFNQDLSTWNVSEVTSMHNIFGGVQRLIKIYQDGT